MQAERGRVLGLGQPGYRGQTGQWAQVLHRLIGTGSHLFLLLHVVDTAVLGWGPDAYDALASFWHQPLFRIGQVGLLGALLFHAINGIRVLIIDFSDWGSLHQERLFWISLVLTLLLFIPGAYLMVAPLFRASWGWDMQYQVAPRAGAVASSCGPGYSCESPRSYWW